MGYKIGKKYIFLVGILLSMVVIVSPVLAVNVQITEDTQLKLQGLAAPLYAKAGSSCDSFTVSGSNLQVVGIPDGEKFSLGTANFTSLEVSPSGGTADLSFDSSHFSSSGYIDQWTINRSGGNSIGFVVKVPETESDYLVKVDGKDYNYYSSDNNGQVTFSYKGAFSTDKVFSIVRKNRPVPYPGQFSLGVKKSYVTSTEENQGRETEELSSATIKGIPAGFVFRNILREGMRSPEVKYLQIILNSDPDTQLAVSGVGSPGHETDYFGPLTKAAVIKFQEKYSKDILSPWKLTRGTGFVGNTTRAKLNEILGKASYVCLPSSTTSAVKPTIKGIPSGFTFRNNLKLGIVSPEVKYLQIVLNSDPDTRLATSGPGSPGSETTYFGSLTKAAVIRFQEKYNKDVLSPWGITKGTGYVYITTTKKLNELIKRKGICKKEEKSL